jgi:hypothetical protein
MTNRLILAGIIFAAAMMPTGIALALYLDDARWLALSAAALLFFMGG